MYKNNARPWQLILTKIEGYMQPKIAMCMLLWYYIVHAHTSAIHSMHMTVHAKLKLWLKTVHNSHLVH